MLRSFLVDNLKALRNLEGGPLVNLPADGPARYVLYDPDGTLRLRTKDGRGVRLESARDPRREAEALVDSALAGEGEAETVAILGVGAGSLLEAVTLRDLRALVIEFDAELASGWLSSRSWVELIAANRLRVIVGPDYVGSAEAAQFLEGVSRLPVIAHPVLAREYPEEMAAARRALDRVVRDALANANARQRFEDLALANTLRNLPALARGADAATLFGRFPNVPAVVVGAGPSLDENLATIRGVQDRALVIAADTALLPCLRAGVVPSLVVALDPAEENGRHLAACAAATDTHLVTEASVDSAGVEAFAGRTFVFRVGDHAPWPWLHAAGVSRGRLSVWGSVVTAALDLALKAGCPAVAFAGLDLAYTGGRPYCRGTVFEEPWAWVVAEGWTLQDYWAQQLSGRPVVEEPDISGTATASSPHLLAFRDWIRETTAAHPGVRFANGTGAGVLHGPRILQQPLDAFLDCYPAVGRPTVAGAIRAAYGSSLAPDIGRQLAARLAGTPPIDVVRGHSAPERAASDIAGPERLAETARRLDAGPVVAPRPEAATTFSTGPRVHLPEQTALLHALTAADRTGLDPGLDAARARADALLGEAYDLLVALVPRARGVRARFETTDLVRLWHRVPARLLFAWPLGLGEAVDTFGSRLAEALRLAGRAHALPRFDAPPAGDDLQCESAVDRARTAAPDPEAQLAPAALIWQWTLVHALTAATDAWLATSLRKLLHAPPSLLPANRPAIRLTAWLERRAPAPNPGRLPLLPGLSTARAISGLVATSAPATPATTPRPQPGVELRLRLTDAADDPLTVLTAIEPESSIARGHPRAHNVSRLSDREVLVGYSDGAGIGVMSESGELVRVETWPAPVRASIPLGAEGRLAWHFPDAPRLLHREVATGQVEVVELPVTVFDALEGPDQSVYLASDDGLWSWRIGEGAQPLVRGPWLVSLSAHGRGVQARERPRRGPDGRWEATTTIHEWQPGDQAFRTTAVAAGAAPFAVAEHRGWRAEAWLDGCAVRLVRPDGRVFWLACSGPRSLAWAGAALYVATAAGEVLRFPDVMVRLANA